VYVSANFCLCVMRSDRVDQSSTDLMEADGSEEIRNPPLSIFA
jgi:hypothetical protein